MSKDFFQFRWFEELSIGDVFKFCPTIIDSDIPSKLFFTVYSKDEVNTKFNATYGRELHKMELANNTPREIMVFPNRKRR